MTDSSTTQNVIYPTDVYEFPIPENLRHKGCPEKVGMVALQPDKENRAKLRAKMDIDMLGDELIKESIFRLGDEEIGAAREKADSFYDNCGSKLAQLVQAAYAMTNRASEEESEDFLGSKRVVLLEDRTCTVFTIPEKFRYWEECPKTIGMVELKRKEDKRARKRVNGQFHLIQQELHKQSIIMVNGDELGSNRAILNDFFEKAGAKLRDLISEAFSELNQPDGQDISAFLYGRGTK